jgi:YfiH family protein
MPAPGTTPPAIGWLAAPAQWSPSVTAGMSTRRGGDSQGHLAESNYSFRVGDIPARVTRNWHRLEAAAAVPLARAARLRLEHGTRIHETSRGNCRLPGDGLVTTRPGLPLVLTVADCLPLMLAVEAHGVALAHCGWRGIAGGIAPAVVHALAAATGCQPAAMDAWIGPGIGPCCFSLPPASAAGWADGRPPAGDSGAVAVDLGACLTAGLVTAGVARGRIRQSPLCTSCHAGLFYSHRRDHGRTGRMLAWIMLGEPQGQHAAPTESQ